MNNKKCCYCKYWTHTDGNMGVCACDKWVDKSDTTDDSKVTPDNGVGFKDLEGCKVMFEVGA